MHVDVQNGRRYLPAMNAVLRENYEAPMLTIEAVEAHLDALHTGQNELREDVRELRADNKSLRDKLDALDQKLSDKVTALDQKLSDKVTALDHKLSDKILQLSDSVSSLHGMQKAILWVISGFGSLGLVGKILHWF